MCSLDEAPTPESEEMSRRTFAALAGAAGVAGGTGAVAAAAGTVETNVEIKTADGVCDAVLTHPEGAGPWPGVLYWPDAFALRPAVREQLKRLAAHGYAVLAVNQFYRSGKAPGVIGELDLSNPASMAKLMKLREPLTAEAVMRDSKTFVAFMDSQKVVAKGKKFGVQGYCMGGGMCFQSDAANPGRFGGAASFHGGALTTDKPDSPHLLVPRLSAEYLVAVADNDDRKQPDSKDRLRAAFEAAKKPAKIEVYTGADHGWTQPDHPGVYNEPAAEKAWAELLALYKRTLV